MISSLQETRVPCCRCGTSNYFICMQKDVEFTFNVRLFRVGIWWLDEYMHLGWINVLRCLHFFSFCTIDGAVIKSRERTLASSPVHTVRISSLLASRGISVVILTPFFTWKCQIGRDHTTERSKFGRHCRNVHIFEAWLADQSCRNMVVTKCTYECARQVQLASPNKLQTRYKMTWHKMLAHTCNFVSLYSMYARYMHLAAKCSAAVDGLNVWYKLIVFVKSGYQTSSTRLLFVT